MNLRYEIWCALGQPSIYVLWVDQMIREWAAENGISGYAPDDPSTTNVSKWCRWKLTTPDGQDLFDQYLVARLASALESLEDTELARSLLGSAIR